MRNKKSCSKSSCSSGSCCKKLKLYNFLVDNNYVSSKDNVELAFIRGVAAFKHKSSSNMSLTDALMLANRNLPVGCVNRAVNRVHRYISSGHKTRAWLVIRNAILA